MRFVLTVHLVLTSILGSSLVYSPPVYSNNNLAEAKRFFEEGKMLQKSENPSAAIDAYKHSFELLPRYSSLYNLAQCYTALKRYQEAMAAYSHLLNEFDSELSLAIKKDAQKQILGIQDVAGILHITVSPEDSEIKLNGENFNAMAQEGSLLLHPGEYEVEISKEGYESVSEKVRIVSKTIETLERSLSPEQAQLNIASTLDDVEVFIDNELTGKTPLSASLVIRPGSHQIVFSHPFYANQTVNISLAPNETATLQVQLTALTGSPPKIKRQHMVTVKRSTNGGLTVKRSTQKDPRFHVALWGTLFSTATSAVLWGVTSSKASDYNNRVDGLTSEWNAEFVAGAAEEQHRIEIFNGAAIGASVAAAAFATWLLIHVRAQKNRNSENRLSLHPAPDGVEYRF